MKIPGVGDETLIGSLRRALDVMADRGELIASNIGNLDTPGYRARDIDFDAALREAVGAREGKVPLRTTRPGHIAGAGASAAARPREVRGLPVRNDGNNVDLEREMLALAETRRRYQVATRLARLRVQELLAAINGGPAR